ncbi:S-adenosyl-L-methionine-dependent methyltransferase [Mariannaea sp. PMI_226]|nr:S-adenosyl-L-methionine-dependent methyltransferase [Mariannaea sp. PMI_226]
MASLQRLVGSMATSESQLQAETIGAAHYALYSKKNEVTNQIDNNNQSLLSKQGPTWDGIMSSQRQPQTVTSPPSTQPPASEPTAGVMTGETTAATTAAEGNIGPTTVNAAANDITDVDPTADLDPNDDEEQNRENMKHGLVVYICGDKLHLAPLDHPQKILDIGTGTGIWAIDMGGEYPSAEITGVDLNKIQPSWVPPNVGFVVDDAEMEWIYPPNSLDYIHLRHMALAIKDMPRLLTQAYRALKPGGWIELQDFLYFTHSEDDSKPDDYKFDEFVRLLHEAFLEFGFDLHGQLKNEGMVKDAGFVNVDHQRYKVPIGTWPDDARLKQAGMYNLAVVHDFFSAVMAPFTRGLGWSTEQVEVFVTDMRRSIQNTSIHAYYTFHTVIGQKPLDAA